MWAVTLILSSAALQLKGSTSAIKEFIKLTTIDRRWKRMCVMEQYDSFIQRTERGKTLITIAKRTKRKCHNRGYLFLIESEFCKNLDKAFLWGNYVVNSPQRSTTKNTSLKIQRSNTPVKTSTASTHKTTGKDLPETQLSASGAESTGANDED